VNAALPKKSARTSKISEEILLKEKCKNFKELYYNSNGHPGCSQTLSDPPKVAIKKSER